MMSTKRLIRPSAGFEGLRNRAVLREADLRDAAFTARRGGRPAGQRVRIDPAREDLSAVLLAHAAAQDGFLPRTRTGSESDSLPKLKKMTRMQEEHGELVILTWLMRALDVEPLKAEATAQKSRKAVDGLLKLYAPHSVGKNRIVAIQRGGQHGCTHAHIVLPLAHLAKTLQATALAAPAGKGGGAWHISDRLHVVRVHPDELAQVAGYISRDPDGRFDLPEDHPDFLQAHAEELERKQRGRQSPRLSW